MVEIVWTIIPAVILIQITFLSPSLLPYVSANQNTRHSYLLYHWWPTPFEVKDLPIDSSSINNNNREGSEIRSRITARIIVQTADHKL